MLAQKFANFQRSLLHFSLDNVNFPFVGKTILNWLRHVEWVEVRPSWVLDG